MRFKEKKKPALGDRRHKWKFCFLPDWCDSTKEWVWLEFVYVTETYKVYKTLVPEGGEVEVVGWRVTSVCGRALKGRWYNLYYSSTL